METANKILRINIVYQLQSTLSDFEKSLLHIQISMYTHAITIYKFIFCLLVKFSIRNNNS